MDKVSFPRLFVFCAAACLTLAFAAMLSGCGSCLGRGGSDGEMGTQTPGSPRQARSQTPVAPRRLRSQSPATPPPPPPVEEEPEPEPLELNVQTAQDIKAGMTYEDVREILGDPGVVIAGTDEENVVYRWSYSGMSFMGRFEDGVLVRKTAVQNAEEHLGRHDDETFSFDKVLYDQVQPGMTYEEVLALIGMDAQPLTGTSERVRIYKWTDERGSSITGRFENKVLKRKSGLILEPEKEGLEKSTEEQPPEETVVAEEADTEAASEEAYVAEEAYVEEAPVEEQRVQVAEAAPVQTKSSRVSVSGSTRRQREHEAAGTHESPERSYHPKVKLPDFKRRLREGVYEIRIHNTTESNLKVALISDEGGLEMRLSPGRHSSAKVGQGSYQVYFINESDPFTLHQGQVIPVADFLSDFSVYLFEDAYDVNFLDKNAPFSRR